MALSDASLLNAESLEQEFRRHVLVDWSVQSQVKPIIIQRAQGCWLYDVRGKAYLDFSSQLINVNIGHSHPKVLAAMEAQMKDLCYVAPGFGNIPRARLAQRLAELTPGDLQKVLFTTGGTEANENAIRIARHFTGRHKIISRYRSFHGGTHGSMMVSGDSRRWANEPGMGGAIHVFDPYCYRCSFGKEPSSCGRECVTHIEEIISYEGPENVAAIMLEAVSGSCGIIVPPEDYWPRIRALCDRYGILLIDDEVMTGFGRTGEWFGLDNWKVAPDIMTFAKGVNCGYVPLGGVIVSQRIADFYEDHPFWGGLTYSGHALACAAGLAALEVYEEENLIQRAKVVGQRFLAELNRLKEKHPSVGDARGIGLFCALELVKDKKTREMLVPWNAPDMGVMAQVRRALLENGLYAMVRWNIIFLAPPLCITEAEMMQGVNTLDEALKIADAAIG